MEKIINKERLEKLLITNWTSFLDRNKLLAFVLSTVRNQKFSIATSDDFTNKNVIVKLSRFELTNTGFEVWADFNVPQQNGCAVGTTELALSFDGKLSHVQTIGTLLKSNNV